MQKLLVATPPTFSSVMPAYTSRGDELNVGLFIHTASAGLFPVSVTVTLVPIMYGPAQAETVAPIETPRMIANLVDRFIDRIA
jgi:hypothetical protein